MFGGSTDFASRCAHHDGPPHNPPCGAHMSKIIRFVPKSERERARLIREARALYDGIFPPADPVREQHDKAPISHTVCGANAYRSDGSLVS
jgi:hypothetical protein